MTAPALPEVPVPLRIAPWARLGKSDVFEICGALASAEATLRRLGLGDEAERVAGAFELAEAGLAG